MSSSEEEEIENINDVSNVSGESGVSVGVDEETVRILVSTDNHLGFAENDNVRGNDSFAALEEVMYLAKHYGADMVLLAGDLFHHNKPSRRTLIRTMDIFRRYCLGQDPIKIQICSNQSQNFRRGLVNYEDENYSIGLPVFSIHGNHDDPTREGGTELFAALDILDTANLVNYFGKQDQVDKVEVSPILIKKGETHLALYGMGSMRDERLNRMWRQNKVTFKRPEKDKQWFNLFALHQNREVGRGAKNCVHESLIPEWMDLVCWGHEHECNIQPEESLVGTFRITQPGSSVATSLVEGEARRKHIGILDIRGQAFRLQPIPLTQVRAFVVGEVSLSQQRQLDPDDPKVESKMTKLLEEKVRMLILYAQDKRQEMEDAARKEGNTVATTEPCPLKYILEKPDEVLVRIRVEHSKFSTLNNQRFGAKFMGCGVANVTDMLLFHRKKGASSTPSTSVDAKLKKAEPVAPDGDMGEMNIEDLIVDEFENSDKGLELFGEKRMTAALESYVQKQQARALEEAVDQLLGKQQHKLIKQGPDDEEEDGCEPEGDGASDDDDDVEEEEDVEMSSEKKKRGRASSNLAAAQKRRGGSKKTSFDDLESDQENEAPPASTRKGRKQAANPSSKAKKSRSMMSTYDEDSDEDDDPPPPSRSTSKSASSSRSTNRRRKQTSYQELSSDDSDEEIEVVDVKKPTRKRQASQASSASSARKQSTARGRRSASSQSPQSQLTQSQLSSFLPKKKTTSRKRTKYQDDSDFEDAAVSRSYDLDDDWGTAKTDTYN